MFNNKYYEQVDDVAMGAPLGAALANIFKSSFESEIVLIISTCVL